MSHVVAVRLWPRFSAFVSSMLYAYSFMRFLDSSSFSTSLCKAEALLYPTWLKSQSLHRFLYYSSFFTDFQVHTMTNYKRKRLSTVSVLFKVLFFLNSLTKNIQSAYISSQGPASQDRRDDGSWVIAVPLCWGPLGPLELSRQCRHDCHVPWLFRSHFYN